MTITITGSKYGSASVSSIGTTTVTVGTTPFVSADFAVTRLLGLWDSTGNTFKGMAWARRWVSTSQIELQTTFFDPATGITATQVVGDTVQVSKNFTDSVQTNLSVSGNVVTISDLLTIGGTASNSVCFYDEEKFVNQTATINSGAGAAANSINGGLTVFGKLDNYSTNAVSSGVKFYLNLTNNIGTGSGLLVTNNANANLCYYGGSINGKASAQSMYVGGNTGAAGNTCIINSAQSFIDLCSPSNGGTWGANAARMQAINNTYGSTLTNSISIRWADGIVKGGSFKFPNYTSAPISITGTDVAGTYSFGAPASSRAVVLDMGNGPVLARTGQSSFVINFNFTNLITTNFQAAVGASGSLVSAPNFTNNFYFQDSYTGLLANSVAVLTLNADSSLVASAASISGTWSPAVLRRQYVGFTQQFVRGPWRYGIKCYGSQPIGGDIVASTYSLGTAGNADNVSFGGAVVQATDANVTLSATAAAALTSIATLDNLYDAAIAWSVANVTNAQYPTLATYPVGGNGNVLNLVALNLVIDANASSAFAINTATGTVTVKAATLAVGSKFKSFVTTGTVSLANGATATAIYTSSAGSTAILQLTGLSGATVYVADSSGAQFAYATGVTGTYTAYLPVGAIGTWSWKVAKYGSISASGTFAPSGNTLSAAVALSADPAITQATVATVAAYTSLSSPDQLYDYAAYYETTNAGIAAARKVAKTGTSADLGAQALTIDANASAPLAVSGTALTIKAATFAPGTTMQALTTTGAISLANNATSTAYLTGSSGSNGIITLTSLPTGSAVALLNSSGTVVQSIASSGATAAFVTPYPSTGSLTYVARRADQVQDTGVVNAAGLSSTATSEAARAYYSSATSSGIAFAPSGAAGTVTVTASSTVTQLWSAWAQYVAQVGNLAVADTWTYDGTTLNTGAWNVAVSGTGVVLTGNLTTTGTVTGSIQGVYTSSAGTSGLLMLSGLQTGSTVYVTNASGAQQDLVLATSGTTYSLSISPAAAATWTWKVAHYGYLEATGTFASSGATAATVLQTVDLGLTQQSVSTVAAYTTIETLDKLYDYDAYRQTTSNGVKFGRAANRAGTAVDLGVRNLLINPNATPVWAVASGTITIAAASLSVGATFQTLTTTGAVSFANGGQILCIYTDSAGRHVKVTALGLISGTRVQLWNTTDGVEVDNSVVGASGYSLPLIYTADKTYRLRATYSSGVTAMLPIQGSGTFGSLGLAFSVAQTADTVYNAAAIDGSTATEFAPDFPNVQVDVSSSGGVTSVQRLYAWLVYEQTQASGIRNFFGAATAPDSANVIIDQSIVNLQLDNVLNTPIRVIGGYLSRKDGSTVIASSSGSIQMDPGKAYVAGLTNALVLSPGERLVTNLNGKYLARA